MTKDLKSEGSEYEFVKKVLLQDEVKPDVLSTLIPMLSLEQAKKIHSDNEISEKNRVAFLKGWVQKQNEMCYQIAGQTLYKQEVTQDEMKRNIELLKKPDFNHPDLIVNNIFKQIATGGGLSGPTPLINEDPEQSLIQFQHGGSKKFPLLHLEDDYESPSSFIKIELPPFMKVKPTSFTPKSPSTTGGIKNFQIIGSNDLSFNGSSILYSVQNAKELQNPNSLFEIQISTQEYFSCFQIQCSENFQGNNHVLFSQFDVSGHILINKQ